jgi:hypothetical protein
MEFHETFFSTSHMSDLIQRRMESFDVLEGRKKGGEVEISGGAIIGDGFRGLPYAICLILHVQPDSWLRRGRLW